MLQFNIHNDQWLIIQKLIPLCCQSYDFEGDAKYPAAHFPSLHCNPIFLIANIKHLQIPDCSFCCGCICRNIQVQEKNCSKSYCCSTGQDRKNKKRSFSYKFILTRDEPIIRGLKSDIFKCKVRFIYVGFRCKRKKVG